jgi:hypothetical protein
MDYFADNQTFAKVIQQYHLVKKIKYYSIYERMDQGA